MPCNSAICTGNSSIQALAANSQIPFGSVARRFGQSIRLEGESITLCGSGYYDVRISCSVPAATTDDVTIQLYQDGDAVPFASATETPAVAGDFVNLDICTMVRNCGKACNSVISVQVNQAVNAGGNMSAVVRKVQGELRRWCQ